MILQLGVKVPEKEHETDGFYTYCEELYYHYNGRTEENGEITLQAFAFGDGTSCQEQYYNLEEFYLHNTEVSDEEAIRMMNVAFFSKEEPPFTVKVTIER